MLVDAASLIYRAFFSSPPTVTAPDGMKVNAAHGFLGMIARLVADHNPQWLACAHDDEWRPDWRVELIESYKAHRVSAGGGEGEALFPGWDETDLDPQVRLIYWLLGLCGVAVISAPGYEAEDVIGALVPRAPGKVAIVSGDRDLFQLVADPKVKVLYPKRGVTEMVFVDEAEIEKRFGIPGRAYGDFALLRGDPSDGLPGVRGVGEKTAAALISKYQSLERVIEAALEGKPSTALAKVGASLDYLDRAAQVSLITADAPIGEPDIERPRGKPDPQVEEVADRYGLLGPVRRLVAALEG